MFKENKEGQTNYCTHLTTNSSGICDGCLGKPMQENIETMQFCPTCKADLPPNHPLRKKEKKGECCATGLPNCGMEGCLNCFPLPEDKEEWIAQFEERFSVEAEANGRTDEEVRNEVIDFISLKKREWEEKARAGEREKMIKRIEKIHEDEIIEVFNSNNRAETKEYIKKGLEIYKKQLLSIIRRS
ncbi:MAG: hypothetical protein WC933_03760 [Candidatus Paceibacterota bacterium]|jgi:hypothetical protein